MTSPKSCRAEADRCRAFAAAATDAGMAERWRRLAVEYDLLAETIEREGQHSPSRRVAVRRQQMQQHHGRTNRRERRQ